MPYNITDVIHKSIDISQNLLEKYNNIEDENQASIAIKVLANVLINEEQLKINYYKKLEEESQKKELNIIEFYVYDKISSLVAQFMKKIYYVSIHEPKGLIKYAIDINEDIRALFVDIRGRLIQKKGDGDSYEFIVVTSMINKQEQYIKDLKKLYKI